MTRDVRVIPPTTVVDFARLRLMERPVLVSAG
jgi:hypothetical protein